MGALAKISESKTISKAASFAVQTKLNVSKPGDRHEVEADRAAAMVVSKGENNASRSVADGVSSSPDISRLHRQVEEKPEAKNQAQDKEEEKVQTKIQKQEEEEEAQPKLQRQAESEEEEEELQTKVQRQEEEEEEAQPKLQRQAEAEDKEEEVQTKIQKQEEEEEEAHPKLQRQAESEEEEEELQPKIQRQAEEEEETVQAKSEPRANVRDKQLYPVLNSVEDRIIARRGMGEPLSDEVRTEMESGFGADFRKVRIHTDAEAARMASEMNAQAFTTSHDIYFNDGKYDPESMIGRVLLAHELTHVIQQGEAERKVKPQNVEQNNQNRNESLPHPADKKAEELKEKVEEDKKLAKEKPSEKANQLKDKKADQAKAKKITGIEKQASGGAKAESKQEKGEEQSVAEFLKQDSKAKLDEKLNGLSTLSKNEKQKDSAVKKLEQSQKAVVPPAQESQSKANASQVKKVEKTEEPKPDEQEIKKDFQDTLKKSLPETLEEATKFKDRGKGREVGEKVRGLVTSDTQKVQSTYKEIENTPEPEPAEKAEEMPAMEAAPETPTVNPGDGVVGTLKDEHTDLSSYNKSTDQILAEEKISEEDLEMVDEGELLEARLERKNLKSEVAQAPASIRKEEQVQKQKVKTDLKKEEQAGKKKMRKDRVQELNKAREKQTGTKNTIEQKRQAVTDKINQIYKDTNDKVKKKLEVLEIQSLKAFDTGQAQATRTFEDNVKRRLDSFKSDRYSGLFGWGRWLKDKLLGMDDLPQVKRIFDSEKASFVSSIDSLIAQITSSNKKVITECKTMIANTRVKIDEYVSSLGPELQDVGKKAQKELNEKLDKLDKLVNQKEQELKQKLAEKREAAIKAIDEKIKKMKESMKGLVSKIGNLLLNALIKFLKWAAKKAGLNLDDVTKNADVIKTIAKAPGKFFKNLMKAVGQGIKQFGKNIRKHLIGGLVEWLFGSFSKEGIQLPKTFDLKGVFGFVAEILGLTYENIKQRVIKKVGPKGAKAFELMEKGVELVKDFIKNGPIALWNHVKNTLGNIKNMILEAIRNFIITKVITEAILWLIGMLNPVGAIVKILKTVYQIVKFFIDNFQRIIEFAKSVFTAVGEIASGALSRAAGAVENALARTVPIIIGFLASLLNLGGLVKSVVGVIRKIGQKVNQAIDKVIDFLVKKARGLLLRIKAGAKTVAGKVQKVTKKVKEKLIMWWKKRKKLKTKDKKAHTIFFKGTGATARLMMASTEMNFRDYLKSIQKEHNLKDNQLGKSPQLVSQIETKIKAAGKAKNKEVHGKQLNELVDKLATEVMNIDLGESTGETTKPLYGPLRQGFGTFAKRVFMKAPLKDKGSEPKVPNTPEFDILNKRRKRNGALFIKGHLLNENLSGPGTTWQNLTPLSQKANSDHKTQFENPVKMAVNNQTSGYADSEHGYAKNFIVKAMYNRKLNTGLINQLEDENVETDQIANMPEGADPETLALILKTERFVPQTLECSVTIGEKKDNKPAVEKVLTKSIDNEINHGDLSEYQIGSDPRIGFNLKEKLSEGEEASITFLMTLNLINREKAKRLHDNLINSGYISNFKSTIGVTKKKLEKENKNFKIINRKS